MSGPADDAARPGDRSGGRFRLLPADSGLGWTPFAWLIYLSALFVEPVARMRAGDPAGLVWTVTLVGVLVFLPAYFRVYWLHGSRLLRVIVFITLLGVLLSPINAGACVLFVYACSFAGHLDRQRDALRVMATIIVTGVIMALLLDAPFFYWLTAALVAPGVGGVNLHFTQAAAAQRKLRLAHDEIEQLAAIAERERIARDLHDVLGHTLSLIVLKAELAAKLADRDLARAADEMRDVENVARRTLQEVREAIRGYRPTLQDELARARTMLKAARVEATVDVTSEALPRAVEETLSLALREAVTNVVRHSGASACTITLVCDEGAANLVVQDDGRGPDGAEGFGLRGMRERVEAHGGTVDVQSAGGARVVIRMPRVATALETNVRKVAR